MSTWRTARWLVAVIAIQTLLLLLLENVMSGFDTGGPVSALISGAVIIGTVGFTWPLVYSLSARFHPLIFPVASFGLSGLVVVFTVRILNQLEPVAVEVTGVWSAILLWLALSTGGTLLAGMFSLNDDVAYDRFVTRPLRRTYLSDQTTDEPGYLFLEIDGLSEQGLRTAIEDGYMPTLERWINEGTHDLVRWETDLSSQTSASQAGILLGANRDIPAFRWWDKQRNTVVASSSYRDAAQIEKGLSTGKGLLAGGGASRWNVFSGDAIDVLGTYSMIGSSEGEGQRSYYAYFSNPFTVTRTAGLFVADVFREWFESIRQRVTNVQPRVRRSFVFGFIRAGTTVLLQEASRFMLTADVYRGVPAVYCTFFAFDEVAHRAGPERRDALKVLRAIDRTIAHLERAIESAPRPYRIVVLSDHGQSQGAPFRQRYGQTLGELVEDLLNGPQVRSPLPPDEGLEGLTSALDEISRRYNLNSGRVMLAALQRADLRREQADDTTTTASPRIPGDSVVVLASGNLGLISFTTFSHRLTLEEIDQHFPNVLGGLRNHPGIGFVMVQSERDGGVVIGAGGVYFLEKDLTVGDNPLTPYGPNAAEHLRRTNTFSNAPDILVMSAYDPDTAEVAAFEEQAGSHGGLGGPQTEPFLLFPSNLPMDRDRQIIGAEQLHRLLRSWMRHDETGQYAPDKTRISTGGSETSP